MPCETSMQMRLHGGLTFAFFIIFSVLSLLCGAFFEVKTMVKDAPLSSRFPHSAESDVWCHRSGIEGGWGGECKRSEGEETVGLQSEHEPLVLKRTSTDSRRTEFQTRDARREIEG